MYKMHIIKNKSLKIPVLDQLFKIKQYQFETDFLTEPEIESNLISKNNNTFSKSNF